jgi:hypothetical protein
MGTGEQICTVSVHSDGTVSGLAATGVDILPVVVVAALLLGAGFAGILIARRRRRIAAAVATAAVIALLLGLPTGGEAAQAADPATACTLIRVEQVRATANTALLPGEAAAALTYVIANPTSFPLEVTVATTLTADPGAIGHLLDTTLQHGPATLAAGPLAHLGTGGPIRLEPGQSAAIAYDIGLSPAAGNAAQQQTAVFDSVITATQL